MPSESLLDLDSLLEPVPGDNPAGDSIPFEIREQMEEGRKEIDPADFADDDPMRPSEPKRADWAGIIRLSQQTLKQHSKDLLVGARLTEALTRRHGFGGLRDGLRLLRRMVDECWDRINPDISDGDLEVRAAPFNWLDDPDKGARFPHALRQVPVIFVDGDGIGFHEWKRAQLIDGKMTEERKAQQRQDADRIARGIEGTPSESVQVLADDLEEAKSELEQIAAVLDAKLGSDAPGLTGLREAVDECRNLCRQILQRKGGGAAPTLDAQTSQPTASSVHTSGGANALEVNLNSRAEVYQQLARCADVLQRLEPHSPIPYIIQRAVALGGLPFPELIQKLILDANVIATLNRELGIENQADASGE